MRSKVMVRLLLGVLICAALVVFVLRYDYINSTYPNPAVFTAKENEAIVYDDVSIQVTGSCILSMQELMEELPKESDVSTMSTFSFWTEDTRVVRVDFTLKSTQQKVFDLMRLKIDDSIFGIAPDYELSLFTSGSSKAHLEPNEEKTVKLYYMHLPISYSAEQWAHFDSLDRVLEIADTYPRRYRIDLEA